MSVPTPISATLCGRPPTALCRRALLLAVFGCFFTTVLTAQPYRYFEDTTKAKLTAPTHIGHESFPIGLFFYHYDFNRSALEQWDVASRVNADHIYVTVEKHIESKYGYQDRWLRYESLVNNAPTGMGVLMMPGYDQSQHLALTHLVGVAREVTFYPFDSAQLSGIAQTGMIFRYGDNNPEIDKFTYWQYDALVKNPTYKVDTVVPHEAIYDTGMANQTVASGIAFDYKSSQTDRWSQNASAFFDGRYYPGPDHPREGQHLVVSGHLFPFGPANPTDSLLQINVYYEVPQGEQYLDTIYWGTDTAGYVLRTAANNLRFLYKTLYFTKADLFPVGSAPLNWDAHRVISKPVNFLKEGDRYGPTTDGVARRIDLEVIYLGKEKVALHSVAIRDSIAELMLGNGIASDGFRQDYLTHIDSLTFATGSTYPKTVSNGIHNMYLTDEPPRMQLLPFRRAKREVENNYIFANGDSLTSNNGAAVPHLQWLGQGDWATNGSYFVSYGCNYGDKMKIYRTVGTDSVTLHDIPSAVHHNGGRFGIPVFFDLDELGTPSYDATMQARIDTMERILQIGRFGAASLQPVDEGTWLIRGLYETAEWGKRSGKNHFAGIGPTSGYFLRLDSTLQQDGVTWNYHTDTIVEHRP